MSIYVGKRTYFAEDNALPNGQKEVKLHQNFVFVILVLAVHVKLFDTLDG